MHYLIIVFIGIGLNVLVSDQPPAKRVQIGIQPTLQGNTRISGLENVTSVTSPVVAAAAVGTTVLPVTPLNGRSTLPHVLSQGPMSRSNARKQLMSWMDAPDDLYFRSTELIKYVLQFFLHSTN